MATLRKAAAFLTLLLAGGGFGQQPFSLTLDHIVPGSAPDKLGIKIRLSGALDAEGRSGRIFDRQKEYNFLWTVDGNGYRPFEADGGLIADKIKLKLILDNSSARQSPEALELLHDAYDADAEILKKVQQYIGDFGSMAVGDKSGTMAVDLITTQTGPLDFVTELARNPNDLRMPAFSLIRGDGNGKTMTSPGSKAPVERPFYDRLNDAISPDNPKNAGFDVCVIAIVMGGDTNSTAPEDRLEKIADSYGRPIFVIDLSPNGCRPLANLCAASHGLSIPKYNPNSKIRSGATGKYVHIDPRETHLDQKIIATATEMFEDAKDAFGYDAFWLRFKHLPPSLAKASEAHGRFDWVNGREKAWLVVPPSPNLAGLLYLALGLLALLGLLVTLLMRRAPKVVEVVPATFAPTPTERRHPEIRRSPEFASRSYALRIVGGNEDGADEAFERGVELGRTQSDPISLRLEGDTSVSKRHARIFLCDDGYYVEDLGSTNGTSVQFKISPQEYSEPREVRRPTKINDGDRIVIGEVVVQYEDVYTRNLGDSSSDPTQKLKK